MTLRRTDYQLEETCGACPEQYDVWLDGQRVGYLRLRHGSFTASYVGEGSYEQIYHAYPEGDGMFEPGERNTYLNQAIAMLDLRIHEGPLPEPESATEEKPRGWTRR